jgi:hypothetical protein
MGRINRQTLPGHVARVAEAALAAKKYVSPIDILSGIGWLDADALQRWRKGQVDCLERVVRSNLPRISAAMKLFRAWARAKGLNPRETHYVAHTRHRPTLRFSRSGAPTIERLYRTHWVSPALAEEKRKRLAERALVAQGGADDAGLAERQQNPRQAGGSHGEEESKTAR